MPVTKYKHCFLIEWWGDSYEPKKKLWKDLFRVQYIEDNFIVDTYEGPIEYCLDFMKQCVPAEPPIIPWVAMSRADETKCPVPYRVNV